MSDDDDNLPLTVTFSVAYLDGVMKHEPAEIARQWRTVREHLHKLAKDSTHVR